MRWQIHTDVEDNSFDYFERTLMTANGFREYDVRWVLGKEINPNGFVVLGRAYGTMMVQAMAEDTMVVGHDFRAYSQDLMRSFIVGLLSTGVRVIDIGLAITPMVYFAQHHFGCKGGASVTASHNENGWTGLKLANGLSSTLGPDGVREFKQIVERGAFIEGAGHYQAFDGLFDLYLDDLVDGIRLQRPLKVVVAAGNGTGGRFAPAVFRRLGCEVVELDCTPDWEFKRHNPNPEDLAFLRDIRQAVLAEAADIGIGIDGDGDRIGVIDDLGREIFADKLGLLVARWIADSHPGRKVVIDVKSTGLYQDDTKLAQTGTEIVICKTGHSYIKAKVAETDAIAGFEKSGHWFFNAPYGRGYDDAPLAGIHLLDMLARSETPLSAQIDALPKTWQSPTIGAYCADDAKYDVVDQMTELYRDDQRSGAVIAGRPIADLITVNGVRFVFADGSWGLVRASSNKPALVLVAEGRGSDDQMRAIMAHIQTRLATFAAVGEYDQEIPPAAG